MDDITKSITELWEAMDGTMETLADLGGLSKEFDEAKHPRGAGGKFGSNDGGASAHHEAMSSAHAAEATTHEQKASEWARRGTQALSDGRTLSAGVLLGQAAFHANAAGAHTEAADAHDRASQYHAVGLSDSAEQSARANRYSDEASARDKKTTEGIYQ